MDRRFRPDRIVEVVAAHHPDILLLQEVDDGVPRSRELDLARELAEELGYPHYAVGHNVSLRKGRYGNATLSRYPILRERNIDLTIGRRKRRGCQHTTLLLERRAGHPHKLEVFNLHLGLSARERQRQAGLLARSPEFVHLHAAAPCILGGDFNDWRSLLRAFFVEGLAFGCASDRETHRGVRGIKTYPSITPRGSLDKVYYRGPLRCISATRCRHRLARMASDHRPLFVDFDLHG